MPKQTGVGLASLNVDDSGGTPRNICDDITNFDFAMPRGVQDVTGVCSSAMARLLLLADFSVNFTGVFNTDANMSHDVFKTIPTTSVARTVTLDLGDASLAQEVLFTDYQITRAADGSLVWTVPGVLANGTFNAWGA